MPHAKPADLPSAGGGRWPAAGDNLRSVQWGDMEVGFTSVEYPRDCTQLYQLGGMPGGVCPCPHYGVVVEGSVLATYPNTDWPDEEAMAGEVYFFPAGHVLKYRGPDPAHRVQPGVRPTAVHGRDAARRRPLHQVDHQHRQPQHDQPPIGGRL